MVGGSQSGGAEEEGGRGGKGGEERGEGAATEGKEARRAPGEGRKVERIWWRLWTVEVRGEF